jgi:SNF2 family DNA or RNA helicase
MFSSHPLTVQGMLKSMLTDDMMRRLMSLTNAKKDPDHPSTKITQWLAALKKQTTMPSKSDQPTQGNQDLQGDRAKLVRQFHTLMTELHDSGQWIERLSRTNCPSCGNFPQGTIITSCNHLYCEECYYSLLNEGNNRSENGKPVCQKCDVGIEEAAHCGSIDNFPINEPVETTTASTSSQAKEKDKPRKKMANGGFGNFARSFASARCDSARTEDALDDDDKTDWIKTAAGDMPGAKLTKTREIITNWLEENNQTKMVVFTQFLDFVQILGATCRKQGWGYTYVRLPSSAVEFDSNILVS